MRTYLAVIDDSAESMLALRFAARRAARTGGGVMVLAVIAPQDFVAFGAVAATMAEEERQRAETIAEGAASAIREEFGLSPRIMVREGAATDIVRELLTDDASIAALVLGAAAEGEPGPLVEHFAGFGAGTLPCPVMIIPGSLSQDALDRLS